MKLPKAINPCPVIDALFEIRYSINIPPNAVFGLVYSVLNKDFGNPESLPILQIPEAVRQNDPNLKYKPHNKLSNENFVVQIGPDVLTVSSYPRYVGWKNFSHQIFRIFKMVEKLQFIIQVERIGLRYINFFEENIYNNINLSLNIGKQNVSYQNTVIRTEINSKNFISTLQVANNAMVNGKPGSLIDIDTWSTNDLTVFFRLMEQKVIEAHDIEKDLFFSLLTPAYLKKLNPVY